MPSPTRKSKEINPMLLRTLNPALFQSPQTPRKSIRKTRVRKSVIFRIVNSVNRTEDTPSKENHYHKKNILNAMNNRLNDKKETIPHQKSLSVSSRNKKKMELLSSFSKEHRVEATLPFLTSSAAMTKYLIREYKDEQTKDYIQNSKKQMVISDKFFEQYHEKLKKRSALLLENFEKVKHFSILDSNLGVLNEEKNLTERKRKNTSSKKTSLRSSRNPTQCNTSSKSNFDMYYRNSEEEYKEVKEQHDILFKKHIKSQGLSLANMILNMEKNEDINNNEDPVCSQTSIVFKNLDNTIYLRKLLKHRNMMKEGDDDLGIDDVERIRTERKDTEYKMVKAMNTLGNPKFLKNKFGKNTVKQFKGVSGKFFGVVC